MDGSSEFQECDQLFGSGTRSIRPKTQKDFTFAKLSIALKEFCG